AVVTHAVAVAVAGLLVNHVRDLGRQFVGVRLVRILRVRSPKLLRPENGRELVTFCRRGSVESWNPLLSVLRRGPGRCNGKNHEAKTQKGDSASNHGKYSAVSLTIVTEGIGWREAAGGS